MSEVAPANSPKTPVGSLTFIHDWSWPVLPASKHIVSTGV
jgi:hypothetical protein